MEILEIFSHKPPLPINCQESYGIWDVLATKYQFLEKIHVFRNFAHDKELNKFMKHLGEVHTEIVSLLEAKCKEFSITGPEQGVIDVNTSINTEIIRDEFIAQDCLIRQQEVTEMLLRNIRTTTTNDSLRELYIRINKINIRLIDEMIDFMKSKGWMNVPLLYPHIPENVNEELDAGEAFHLWDHLTFRYDNMRQTEIYKDTVKDKKFQLLIVIALEQVLKSQAEKLEKECLHFGIPMPKRPANITSWPQEIKRYIADDYIYRVLYSGIVGAAIMHVNAVKQSTTNKRIRKLFIELLLDEIYIQDKFIKYGKTKGYLNEPPQYNSQKSPAKH